VLKRTIGADGFGVNSGRLHLRIGGTNCSSIRRRSFRIRGRMEESRPRDHARATNTPQAPIRKNGGGANVGVCQRAAVRRIRIAKKMVSARCSGAIGSWFESRDEHILTRLTRLDGSGTGLCFMHYRKRWRPRTAEKKWGWKQKWACACNLAGQTAASEAYELID